MSSIDELNGKLTRITQALNSAEGRYICEILEDVAKNKLTADLMAKGEEAIRALGFQQGIGVIKILPDMIKQDIEIIKARSEQDLKNKLKIR